MKIPLSCLLLFSVVPLWTQPSNLPENVASQKLAQRVLDQNYLLITGNGKVEVVYEQVLEILQQPNLLEIGQQAYADLQENGKKPSLVIREEKPGVYSYSRKEEGKTIIAEVYRGRDSEGNMELITYSKGERSFGPFQALSHITLSPHAELADTTTWSVQVFAYPENGFSRFFARAFGIAQRKFNKKTEDISKMITDISVHIIENQQVHE
jgi:hypothetical protein